MPDCERFICPVCEEEFTIAADAQEIICPACGEHFFVSGGELIAPEDPEGYEPEDSFAQAESRFFRILDEYTGFLTVDKDASGLDPHTGEACICFCDPDGFEGSDAMEYERELMLRADQLQAWLEDRTGIPVEVDADVLDYEMCLTGFFTVCFPVVPEAVETLTEQVLETVTAVFTHHRSGCC